MVDFPFEISMSFTRNMLLLYFLWQQKSHATV